MPLSTSLLFALGAMLLFGVGDLIYKRAAIAGVPSHQFLMGQAWLFAPTVITIALATGATFNAAALWGSAAGLCSFVGFYNFSRSLATGSISVNAPIFRLSFTLTAALAVLILNEPPTPLKMTGLAAALVAAWLLLGGTPRGGNAIAVGSLARVGVATVAMGVGSLLYKIGLLAGSSPAALVAAQAAVFMPLATTFSFWREKRLWPSRATLRYGPIAGLALVGAFLLMLQALVGGQASVLVPIAQMGFVATALFGVLFLGEPFSLRKALGLAMAAGALICLALS
jgi:uncharacterized membrane protein